MNAPQLVALGAFGAGLLSLVLQLAALCVGADEGERWVFVRASHAIAVLALALLSTAFVL